MNANMKTYIFYQSNQFIEGHFYVRYIFCLKTDLIKNCMNDNKIKTLY